MAKDDENYAYVRNDGSFELPEDTAFELSKILIDGLKNIRDGFGPPVFMFAFNKKKRELRVEVTTRGASLKKVFPCLTEKDGNFE